MRAVRNELLPVSGPRRSEVHKIIAAFIPRAFDGDNPESDVGDETVVTVRFKRHTFIKESSFIAGDLRMENKNALRMLTERFLNDPVVIVGELEPAAAVSPACEGSPPHDSGDDATRREPEAEAEVPTTASIEPAELSDAAVMSTKRGGPDREVRRVGDGFKVPALPWGLYADSEDAAGGKTMRLKVKLGAFWVNGEQVAPARKMKVVGGIGVNTGNIAALRSLRDDFALGLGASTHVRRIIAAKAFRLWLRRRQSSEILDSVPVSITHTTATPTADGLLPSVVMPAGRLREVDAERASMLRELLVALGAAGAGLQSESQGQSMVVVDDDGPSPSGSSGKRSEGRKRKHEEEVARSDAAMQPARKNSLENSEQRGVEGSSRSSSGGEKGDEQRGSAKLAKKNRSRKDQGISMQAQPEQESGTTNGATQTPEHVGKNNGCQNSSDGQVGAVVAIVSSASRPPEKKRRIKHQGAASRSDEPTPLPAASMSNKIKSKGSVESTASGSGSGGSVRQNHDDNPAGDTSPKRASKKRSRAIDNASRSAQSAQPIESTEAEERRKKKALKQKRKAAEGRSKGTSGGSEDSVQESAAGKEGMSVIDLTSDSSATPVKKKTTKKKRRRAENLPCSHDRAQPDEVTEGRLERKKRKARRKAPHKNSSSSSSSSESRGGNDPPQRQQAHPAADCRNKKNKRKSREREEEWKCKDDQAHPDTLTQGEESHSSKSIAGNEGSPQDSSGSSPKQDKRSRKKKKKRIEEAQQ